MAALPGQRPKEYRETLRKAADLGPEHISAYSLIVEEGTPFYDWYGEAGGKGSGSGTGKSIKKNNADMEPRTLSLPSEEEERLMDKWSGEILAEYGYRRYEISNYARPGYECRHNMAYWKRYDYVGFGLGAASMVGNVRWKNCTEMEKYICCMEKEALPKKETLSEKRMEMVKEEICGLSIQEQMEEFMFLGLRLTEG